MKNCPVCNAQLNDEVAFCTQCGTPLRDGQGPEAQAAPYVDPYDHTKEFSAQDISDNKVFAMLMYLTGWILSLIHI